MASQNPHGVDGAPAPDDDPLIGRVLDTQYEILKRLGEGSFGAVYLGRSVSVESKVAIKHLKPEFMQDENSKARFRQEAKILGRLHHPNIVAVLQFEEKDYGFFIVMEYVEGKTLFERIEQTRPGFLTFDFVERVMRRVFSAVEEGHAHGVIHRDLKPENVIVDEIHGGVLEVKVLDYGVSKIVQKDGGVGEGPVLTQYQSEGLLPFIGTPQYMAPELFDRQDGVPVGPTERSDVYALGVMVYYMLTGRLPFDGNSVWDIAFKVVSGVKMAPNPQGYRPEIPEALAAAVMGAIRKNAKERFQTVAEFRKAFEAGMEEAATREKARYLSMRPSNADVQSDIHVSVGTPVPPSVRQSREATTLPRPITLPRPPGVPADVQALGPATPPPEAGHDPEQPALNRRKLVAVATACVLLGVAGTSAFLFFTAPAKKGTPASPTASAVVTPPPVPALAVTGTQPPPWTTPSERQQSPAPAADDPSLARAKEQCKANPRRTNQACARYCAGSPKDDPFHGPSCILAGKPE